MKVANSLHSSFYNAVHSWYILKKLYLYLQQSIVVALGLKQALILRVSAPTAPFQRHRLNDPSRKDALQMDQVHLSEKDNTGYVPF